MNSDLILDFSALNKLAEQKKLSENAEKFIYLIWLGLTHSEISSARSEIEKAEISAELIYENGIFQYAI